MNVCFYDKIRTVVQVENTESTKTIPGNILY